jgi:hypothetical protein
VSPLRPFPSLSSRRTNTDSPFETSVFFAGSFAVLCSPPGRLRYRGCRQRCQGEGVDAAEMRRGSELDREGGRRLRDNVRAGGMLSSHCSVASGCSRRVRLAASLHLGVGRGSSIRRHSVRYRREALARNLLHVAVRRFRAGRGQTQQCQRLMTSTFSPLAKSTGLLPFTARRRG